MAMKDGNEGTLLDPELWQRLPEDILERVIAKLPFSRVVKFRGVCKKWYSDVIPRAALHLEASSRFVFLDIHYLQWNSQPPGSALWMRVCNFTTESIGSMKEFQSRSFPALRGGECIELLICERGLLFFGLICMETCMMRDIVVCNPLLSKSKSLGLPRPLKPNWDWSTGELFVGVTFDSKTGCYCLLYAGEDETCQQMTFLYASLTSAWTKGSSFPAVVQEVGVNLVRSRSFGCNGNIYWIVKNIRFEREYVLKFDNQHGAWSLIPIPLCEDYMPGTIQGATSKGEILLWHLHDRPLKGFERSPDVDWPCRSFGNAELAPEINPIPHYMMENIYQFVLREPFKMIYAYDYLVFSEQNIIYHVMQKRNGLFVLVHDTNLDSYIELPTGLVNGHCIPKNVWSFSASLTSMP